MKKQLLYVPLAALALASCAPVSQVSAPGSSTTAGPSLATLSPVQGPQAPGDEPRLSTSLRWDQDVRREALSTAVTAVSLYSRPGVEKTQWLRELSPYITQQFAADFQSVDTKYIASTKVERTGELLVDEANVFGCTAVVGTDAGKLTVKLLRNDAEPSWKVESIVPELGKGAGK
jgi:hypothetical protein